MNSSSTLLTRTNEGVSCAKRQARAAVALTASTVTSACANELESVAGGPVEIISLSELRSLRTLELVQRMFRIASDRIFLVSDTRDNPAVQRMLEAVAFFTRCGRIEVFSPGSAPRRLSRHGIACRLVELGAASLKGRIAYGRAVRETRALLKEPRQHVSSINSPCRVIHLNANLWFDVAAGGSVGHIAGVANGLVDLGFSVDHATLSGNKQLAPGVRVRKLYAPRCLGIPYEFNYYRTHQAVTSCLLDGSEQYDCIYQRMSLCNYSGVVLSRKLGIPLVLEYNSSEAWVANNWGKPLVDTKLAVAVEDVCLRHAHLVVTVSDVLRDELIARGVERNRIVTYPNCVDPAVFHPDRFDRHDVAALRTWLGIAENAVVACFTGTFGRWHGVELLAETIQDMVDHERAWLARHNVHFLLVGEGPLMRVARERIGGPRYAPWVTFTGLVPQAEAPSYLAASDLFLSPHVPNPDGSRFFGSPTKLFEYMAMGKPVLASRLDQIADVLSPGIDAAMTGDAGTINPEGAVAVLFEPGSGDQFKQGLRWLVEKPAARKALGDSGRTRVLERYTWHHHVKAITEAMARIEGLED